jgi:hypothetical protein
LAWKEQRVTGLDRFGLNESSFRRLGNLKVLGYVYLKTYDLTPVIRRLPISKRLAHMSTRVDSWIKRLHRLHPHLTFQTKGAQLSGAKVRRWSQLPATLIVQGTAREVLTLAKAPEINLIYIHKIAGRRRRRSTKSSPTWYCVRAFVVIQVESAKSGMQNTEDRFILVRASSCDDAKKRLKKRWREYANPYLNSNGQMVSWSLEKIIDVYDTCEADTDPTGTEVYSKLGHRRMRPEYVWRPKPW